MTIMRPPLARAAGVLATIWFAGCMQPESRPGISGNLESVGRVGPNRAVTPVNQVLTPFGRVVELPGLRPQALALSPDGRLLIVSGKSSELVVIDPVSGA